MSPHRQITSAFLFLAALILLQPVAPLHGGAYCGNSASGGPGEGPGGDDSDSSNPPDPDCGGVNYFKVATGNVGRSVTDFVFPELPGVPSFAFRRHGYSRHSIGARHFGWGHHWFHDYSWRLVSAGMDPELSQPLYDVFQPDGSTVRFYRDGDSSFWRAAADRKEVLQLQADGTFQLLRPEGGRYDFTPSNDGSGLQYRLSQILDENDHARTMLYNPKSGDRNVPIMREVVAWRGDAAVFPAKRSSPGG